MDGRAPPRRLYEIGGTPQSNPEEYRFRSPITYLENVETPVLLLHHEGDLRCPIGQSEEMFQALKVLGKEVEFVRYPGGFHTYNTHEPSQIVDRARRLLSWYEAHSPRTPQRPSRERRRKAAALGALTAAGQPMGCTPCLSRSRRGDRLTGG